MPPGLLADWPLQIKILISAQIQNCLLKLS